ncbi:transposase [Streptomyces californicus]|uniref:transposase n=1 Tax=Streptomyces californicus TaxID=67351 RepID=UPI00379EC8F4
MGVRPPSAARSERGRKRPDDRTVLNRIVWKFRTGTAWRDVPERYGSWATLHTRFRRWARDGTFERMLREAQAQAGAPDGIGQLVSVGSTALRAHQHAAGARTGGFEPGTQTRGSHGQSAIRLCSECKRRLRPPAPPSHRATPRKRTGRRSW